jgi:hypothetical protein
MRSALWGRRIAALAALGLAGLCIASVIAVTGDVLEVRNARASVPDIVRSADAPAASASLRPMVQVRAGNPETAIGEYLNTRFGDLGLLVNGATVVSLRPLGRGLRLAEVRVSGSGDATAAGSIANWIAVNREAVRLKALTLTKGSDGRGRLELTLLMVFA